MEQIKEKDMEVMTFEKLQLNFITEIKQKTAGTIRSHANRQCAAYQSLLGNRQSHRRKAIGKLGQSRCTHPVERTAKRVSGNGRFFNRKFVVNGAVLY